jgi:hypothetical protein
VICCLLEKSFTSGLGFEINSFPGIRKDAFLFGEGQGRAVVTVSPAVRESFEASLTGMNLPFFAAGAVKGNDALVDGESYGEVNALKSVYDTALQKKLEQE